MQFEKVMLCCVVLWWRQYTKQTQLEVMSSEKAAAMLQLEQARRLQAKVTHLSSLQVNNVILEVYC
jgi:hypothetical protein